MVLKAVLGAGGAQSVGLSGTMRIPLIVSLMLLNIPSDYPLIHDSLLGARKACSAPKAVQGGHFYDCYKTDS